MKLITTLIFLLLNSLSYSQEKSKQLAGAYHNDGTDTIYEKTEHMPEFPGGDNQLIKFLSENMKYPAEAREKEITGRVFVFFIVDKAGKIQNPRILRGIGGGCDEEVLRVISLMPAWKPGLQNEKPVMTQFTLPVNFNMH